MTTPEAISETTPVIIVDVNETGFKQLFDLTGSGVSISELESLLADQPGKPGLRPLRISSERHDIYEAYPRTPRGKIEGICHTLGVAVSFTPDALDVFKKEPTLNTA